MRLPPSTAAFGQLGAWDRRRAAGVGGVFQIHRLCALSNTALLHVAASRSSPSCSPQPQCGEPCPKCQAPTSREKTMGWSGGFPLSSTPRHHAVIRSCYPNFFVPCWGLMLENSSEVGSSQSRQGHDIVDDNGLFDGRHPTGLQLALTSPGLRRRRGNLRFHLCLQRRQNPFHPRRCSSKLFSLAKRVRF